MGHVSGQALVYARPDIQILLPVLLKNATQLPEPSTRHTIWSFACRRRDEPSHRWRLGWFGGDPDWEDAITYDVYREANDSTPDSVVCSNITSTTCDPGTLNDKTRYYWQVIATDRHGASQAGPVWEFTSGTSNNPPYPFQPLRRPTTRPARSST